MDTLTTDKLEELIEKEELYLLYFSVAKSKLDKVYKEVVLAAADKVKIQVYEAPAAEFSDLVERNRIVSGSTVAFMLGKILLKKWSGAYTNQELQKEFRHEQERASADPDGDAVSKLNQPKGSRAKQSK